MHVEQESRDTVPSVVPYPDEVVARQDRQGAEQRLVEDPGPASSPESYEVSDLGFSGSDPSPPPRPLHHGWKSFRTIATWAR